MLVNFKNTTYLDFNTFSVYVAHIPPAMISQLLAESKILPQPLQERIKQRQLNHDKAASIQAWLLLKEYLLTQSLHHQDLLHNIQFSPQGKPSFSETDCKLYFNFSHSHEKIICAISHTHQIGVDIEKVMPFDTQILNEYFDLNEQQFISQANVPMEAFYTLWTKKEAFIKCTGEGITKKDLATINVLQKNIVLDEQPYIFHSINVGYGYVANVCIY